MHRFVAFVMATQFFFAIPGWTETVCSGYPATVSETCQRQKTELLKMGMSEELATQLIPYLNPEEDDTIVFLKSVLSHGIPDLNDDDIDAINRSLMQYASEKAVQQWDGIIDVVHVEYPNARYFHQHDSRQQTLLFSQFYKDGTYFRNFPFLKAVLENDWPQATDMLRKEARHYLDNPQTRWRARRLFEETNWYNK